MKVFVPDYYAGFRCIAGACRHSCCVGWEIDVDSETLKRYRTMKGPLGAKLKRCIDPDPEPHFVLSAEERCPFLTDQNLCEILLRAGEDALCQICADHPRFRNYWSDRIEMGLGMACEEAARLILTSPHPLRLVPLSEEREEQPEIPSEAELALRNHRDRLLASVAETGPAARLREYLIYRHMADALYDGRIAQRTRLVDRAFERITAGWDGQSGSDLAERARVFSNEVEYDDEKLELFLSETEGDSIDNV
ncbi:MAG: flagellin lysine-N-methylase [Clostridia bacterium]|nr:flagellin lysine-N-methylase [Clostridia bacterium]